MNPYVVARRVHTVPLILGCWLLGGLWRWPARIYAELAAQRPLSIGGQYASPAMLIIRRGARMAGPCCWWSDRRHGGVVTSARLRELTHLPLKDGAIAALVLLLLTIVNCLGVKAGSTVQSSDGDQDFAIGMLAAPLVRRLLIQHGRADAPSFGLLQRGRHVP